MKIKHLIIATLSISMFMGCKTNKKDIFIPKTNNPSSSIEQFFDNSGAQKQNFEVNVDNEEVTITGEKGTTVTFPESSFVDANGDIVTGNIQIELIEVYDQVDMVLSNLPTTSDGELLISGGEIFIGASANGVELDLRDSTSIMITFAATTVDPDMTLFTGGIDSTTNQFDWTEVPNVIDSQQGSADSTWSTNTDTYFYYNPSVYIFTTTNIGWINCDQFYEVPTTTTINVTCDGVIDNTNLRGFIVFKNLNSAASLYNMTNPEQLSASRVPVGEEVSIVIFYLNEGKEYIGIKEATISADMQLNINLEESSEADIVAMIKQKFN